MLQISVEAAVLLEQFLARSMKLLNDRVISHIVVHVLTGRLGSLPAGLHRRLGVQLHDTLRVFRLDLFQVTEQRSRVTRKLFMKFATSSTCFFDDRVIAHGHSSISC